MNQIVKAAIITLVILGIIGFVLYVLIFIPKG